MTKDERVDCFPPKLPGCKHFFLKLGKTGTVLYQPRVLFEAEHNLYDLRSGYREVFTGLYALELIPGLDEALWTPDMVDRLASGAVVQGPEGAPQFRIPRLLEEESYLERMETKFLKYLVRHGGVEILSNVALNVFSRFNERREDFGERCTGTAKYALRKELDRAWDLFERKLEQVKERGLRHPELFEDRSDLHRIIERIANLFLDDDLESALPVSGPQRYPTGRNETEFHLAYLEEEARRQVQDLKRQYYEKARAIESYRIHLRLAEIEIVKRGLLWTPGDPV
ncbi:MAG: hypothetical protein HY652_11405 [Acidobacteria bacterium]|nr:hypothetical protein [Acidobacteriota bacterium]